MSRPFWFLNLGLVFYLIIALIFTLLTQIKVPSYRASKLISKPGTITSQGLDLKIIYNNDLFGTIKPIVEEAKKEVEALPHIPTPPQRISITPPRQAVFKFLEPMPITLTGIIYYDDRSKDTAIILDNRTKKEGLYKIEDEIEDAQLINISPDKIILLRSNGQQEIVYLTQESKEKKTAAKDWSKIVDLLQIGEYQINKVELLKEISSLSELIFKFNVKSALKNGKAIGIRIGKLPVGALALSMGFKTGDLIKSINGIELGSMDDRLAAYKNVINSKSNKVVAELVRNGKTQKVIYNIKEYLDKNVKSRYKNSEIKIKFEEDSFEQKPKLEKYSKIVEEAKNRDKENIFKFKKK